jgi:hypothetical protein
MPDGVLGVVEASRRLDSHFAKRAFCSAMRLTKANSMRVTASGPRSAASQSGSTFWAVDFRATPLT